MQRTKRAADLLIQRSYSYPCISLPPSLSLSLSLSLCNYRSILSIYRSISWAYAERFWGGFTKSSWGSGGRCEPPSGVRGGALEDFEINTFQRLRTPVSLSFLSQCCLTKIHAIFFIHSHPHHFQLNEVGPNHTLWYQKSQCQRIALFWVLFFTCTMRLVGVLNFRNSSSLCSKAKKQLFTVISTCTLCQSDGREYSLYMRAWLTVFTLRWCLATVALTMP